MFNIFITYELFNPITNQVFYVGAGLPERPKVHIDEVLKGPKRQKYNRKKYEVIKSILEANQEVDIRIVLETDNRYEAFDYEIRLIRWYGRKDKEFGPLLNMTDGGDGGDAFSSYSEEEKNKIWAKREEKMPPMEERTAGWKKFRENATEEELKAWYKTQGDSRRKIRYCKFGDEFEVRVENLEEFCQENDLSYDRMMALSRDGATKPHKGWLCRFEDEPYKIKSTKDLIMCWLQYENEKPFQRQNVAVRRYLRSIGFEGDINVIIENLRNGNREPYMGWHCWYGE